jgi:hypothetical protein
LDTAFISRTLRATLLLTALSYLLFTYYKGGSWALGFCLGALWSAANLYLLREIVTRLITVGDRPMTALLVLVLLKFPLLYLGGYFILAAGSYPVASPLLGFGLPLAVLVLKAAGRLLLGIHGPDAGRLSRRVISEPKPR